MRLDWIGGVLLGGAEKKPSAIQPSQCFEKKRDACIRKLAIQNNILMPFRMWGGGEGARQSLWVVVQPSG